MAQVSLTLRPPPNVDFVNGFPGIPPAQDRPQAVVKGAIELRTPAAGVKAKWVRIELRKIEKLPHGGADSEFYDFVGPSPVNLWTSPDEYGLLRSQDFPFAIRIPESIPPSVELDNRGQISYELIATVCTKGKKGFLRKAKAVVQQSKAAITIDKHELHSTWPIYCQHEQRNASRDGVTLIVERNHTCFGPGDRIAVSAIVKSDSLHTVVLSSLELALRETLRLHPNSFVGMRRVQPQKFEKVVVKQVLDVNATLYGGSQQMAELWCTLNPNHTTPTLTSARHMDINYNIIVKATLQTGTSVFLELPVIISNWPRAASAQAIRQIGPTPNLSLIPATPNPTGGSAFSQPHRPVTAGSQNPVVSSTLPITRPSNEGASYATNGNYATANPAGLKPKASADEFGYTGGSGVGSPSRPGFNTGPSGAPSSSANTHARRPSSSGGRGANRLTITNPEVVLEHPAPSRSRVDSGSGGAAGAGGAKPWLSAEQEKKLYEEARKRVEGTWGPHAAPAPLNDRRSPPPRDTSPASGSTSHAAPTPVPNNSGGPSGQWLSAEQEKVLLFEKAKEAALRHQDPNAFRPPSAGGSGGVAGGSGGSKLTGAQLYEQAMAARKNNEPALVPTNVNANTNSPPRNPSTTSGVPKYPTADQEKAALRRYEEAKRAVDKRGDVGVGGNGDGAGPIAYDALFPNNAGGGGGSGVGAGQVPPPQVGEVPPPPFGAGGAAATGARAILSEKERLRREYEARDAAALNQQQQQQQQPPPFTPPQYGGPLPPASPQIPTAPQPSQYASAIAEKEALRRKFEEKDRMAALAAAAAKAQAERGGAPPPGQVPSYSPNASPTPAPLKPVNGGGAGGLPGYAQQVPSYAAPPLPLQPRSPPATPGGSRPTPQPPSVSSSGSGSKVLTAAEEKALLKAKYDAMDAAGGGRPQPPPPKLNGGSGGVQGGQGQGQGQGGGGLGSLPPHTFASPPPLMPRPPAEYIQETREEDERVGRTLSDVDVDGVGVAALDVHVKPLTPFGTKFEGEGSDGSTANRTATPPIPPKPAGE